MMKSEEHFHTIFNAVNDAIFIYDLEGNILEVNQVAAERLGYGKAELLSMKASDINTPDEAIQMPARIEELLKKGQLLFESTHVRKDGTKINVEVNAKAIDYNGKPAVLSIKRDITERKKIEQTLIEAKDFSERLIDTANAMIIGLDIGGQITVFNKTAEAITGYKKQELEDKNWFEVLVPKDRYSYVHEEFNRLIAGGLPKQFENPILTKTGEERYITWQNKELLEQGKIIGTISFGIDITERKRAEEALRDSDARFRALFNDMAEGVCLHKLVFNEQGVAVNYEILDVNVQYEAILNLKKEVIIHKLSTEVYGVPEPPYLSEYAEVVKTGKPFHFETYFSPIEKYFYISVSPLGGGNFATIFFDITERNKAERNIEAKNKELEQIVYVTSHDLRSPLVNVQGYSKELGYSVNALKMFLSKLDLPAEISEKVKTIVENDISASLKYIENSIAKMDSLLQGLLRFSRSGTMTIRLENLNMNDLIAKVISDFEFLIKTSKTYVELSDLPQCMGDNILVNQVFSNVIDNALKYFDPNREGIIKISGVKKKGRSIYYVEDNGLGIAKEHIHKIFEIFYRLNPKNTGGEGLGLSIVQKILGRLNGDIYVDSELGKGSKFYIILPGI